MAEKNLVIYIPKREGQIQVRRAPKGYRYEVKDWSDRG